MSGMPIFVDPSTTVVYHTVPPANTSSNIPGFVTGAYPLQQQQQQAPPSMAMMLVQNNPPQQPDSSTSIPLPPGMEIVLGDKKYTVQYQSYEMPRERATEYIAKCTGTPFPRMSSPPVPSPIPTGECTRGVVGGGTSTNDRSRTPMVGPVPTGASPLPAAETLVGDRGTIITSPPPSALSEEKEQRQKSPNELYRTMGQSASTKGVLLSQQQQQHTVVAKQATADGIGYLPPPAYAPPLRGAEQQQEQNMGYFWEDGVWKLWQAGSGINSAAGTVGDAAAKTPLPLQVQQKPAYTQQQYQPQQHQHEIPQYQYQYQYQYSPQQQQPPAIATTNTVHDPASYAIQQVQHPGHQLAQTRGAPPTDTRQYY